MSETTARVESKQQKPNSTAEKAKAKKKKKKGKGGKIVLAVILLLIAGGVAVVYFNLFGAQEIVFSRLRDLPFVGRFIPEEPEPDPYEGISIEQLISENQRLTTQLENTQADLKDAQDLNALRAVEITRLKEFEDQQAEYKTMKDEFDREVFEYNPDEFRKYYESFSPDNAEIFYKEAVGIQQQSATARTYYNKIAGMDEKAAALMLEELIATDMELVVDIMLHLNVERAAEILNKMTPANAALVVKYTHPE